MKNKISVCVFGSSGFLGGSIVKELSARGVDWVGVNAVSRQRGQDYLLSELLGSKLPDRISTCDYFINAAGGWKPKTAERNPDEAVSSMLSIAISVMKVLKKAGALKVLHLSSAGTVYGESGSGPLSETHHPAPISWYGRGKLLEENYLERNSADSGIEYVCARVSNPFGNRNQASHGFIDVLIDCCRAGRRFNVFRDVDPYRDFIFAADMAAYICDLLLGPQVGVFNVGSGRSYSTRSICDFVEAKYGFRGVLEGLTQPSYDVVKNELSVSKLLTACGARNTIDVYEYVDLQLGSKLESAIA